MSNLKEVCKVVNQSNALYVSILPKLVEWMAGWEGKQIKRECDDEYVAKFTRERKELGEQYGVRISATYGNEISLYVSINCISYNHRMGTNQYSKNYFREPFVREKTKTYRHDPAPLVPPFPKLTPRQLLANEAKLKQLKERLKVYETLEDQYRLPLWEIVNRPKEQAEREALRASKSAE